MLSNYLMQGHPARTCHLWRVLLLMLAIGLLPGLGMSPAQAAGEGNRIKAAEGRNAVKVKVGLLSDTHYDREKFPERAEKVSAAIRTFNRAGVDVVLALGDLYEGNFDGVNDYLADKELFEPVWRGAKAPVHWVLGNHDHWGVSNEQFIRDNPYIKAINYTFDVGESWRFVVYSNVDDKYFSATSSTLAWLGAALEQAGREGKNVVVVAHARIDQDYPGNPPIMLKEPYSAFSYNAGRQREIIRDAVARGVRVRYVLHGHQHQNVETTGGGVTYLTFAALAGGAKAVILELADERLIGFESE